MPYKIVKVHRYEEDVNRYGDPNNTIFEVLSERVEALMNLGYLCQGGVAVLYEDGEIIKVYQAMAY